MQQFLARVPADMIERMKGRRVSLVLPASGPEGEVTVETKLGRFVKFSLATRDPETAVVRRAAVKADLSRLFDGVRRGPAPLSPRQVVALSGEVYRQLVDQHSENPGTPDQWERFKALTRAALEGKIPGAPPISHQGRADDAIIAELLFGNDATAVIDALAPDYGDRALEQRVGRLTLWVLDRHGIEVDDERRLTLMREIAKAALQAAWTIKRASRGDFRPDPDANRFPEFKAVPGVSSDRAWTTFEACNTAWAASELPKLGSKRNRQTATSNLAAHVGHNDMSRVTGDDIMAWRASMMESGLAPGTCKTKLSDARAAFGYAFAYKMIPTNPFTGLRIGIKANRMAPRERRKGYTSEEVAAILSLSGDESRPFLKWLPMLAATTGARITELSQLWKERVRCIDGVWTLEIRPAEDGGSVKTEASARDVPIHPLVMEAGFLAFVKKSKPGPLFYRLTKDRSPELVHPSKNVADRLGRWIRDAGFTDESKAPNHAFRHFWKTRAFQCGVSSDVADWLQGHRTPGEASRYRHIEADREALARAVASVTIPSNDREPDGAMPVPMQASSPQ
ncbi:DUF6538 domain-containing protein [Methylobacterium sp. WCS2018Hpa-22]|uniref:DUF6538 domain-containing protein n=1 Tax=Methylobacterium sp. WCS2018Hpa-22 TaxID=3073633 RepID=UPI00288B6BB6|nr:DUF6538 domain-containing protein [Methylobacterium sp. WCS2018Hpa-22]